MVQRGVEVGQGGKGVGQLQLKPTRRREISPRPDVQRKSGAGDETRSGIRVLTS